MTSEKSKYLSKVLTQTKPHKRMLLKPIYKRKIQTFLQNTHLMTSMIQFVLQNFPTNWNKQTSYRHIKKSKLSKENYRPISILPNVSKIYERCLYDQIATYFEHVFSRYQCVFRKGHSAQQCLLAMVDKWGKSRCWGCFWSTIDWSILGFWLYSAWSDHCQIRGI